MGYSVALCNSTVKSSFGTTRRCPVYDLRLQCASPRRVVRGLSTAPPTGRAGGWAKFLVERLLRLLTLFGLGW